MMTRGGYPFEENSIGPGTLRFDSDNRTCNNHFLQQFNRQFNRDRSHSTGGRMAATTAHSTDCNVYHSEYAGCRRMAATSTDSAEFGRASQWVVCLRVF